MSPATIVDAAVPATPTAAASLGRIELRQVSIHLGSGPGRYQAVKNLSCTIEAGEFACILGPSGCGKSTLLGAVAGHLHADGQVLLDGRPVSGPDQDRGLVFQQHSLFPWKTVLGNVAFGLKMRGVGSKERRLRALEFISLVGLDGFAQCYPSQLSGGMQQRAEIARVLINHPRVVLMDEPFGALDALCRLQMQELLLETWARIRTTVLFVTHDIDEALFLSDRIFLMSHRPGRICEILAVDAPRPRRPELITSDGFVRMKRRCVEFLRLTTSQEPSRPTG
jgi:NitT/TauT family transport system ATP-binding protein